MLFIVPPVLSLLPLLLTVLDTSRELDLVSVPAVVDSNLFFLLTLVLDMISIIYPDSSAQFAFCVVFYSGLHVRCHVMYIVYIHTVCNLVP